MAILNNQMVNHNWLVVGIPTPLKKKNCWDDDSVPTFYGKKVI